jgi:RimJ/RimL family protein N-acetyltransferase
MIINNYNITLKRVQYNDIEMLRMWRNSEFVKKYMNFKGYITVEMQKQWFSSIDESCNYYFIVYDDDYPVALTEIKNIIGSKGNLGIFIANEDILTTKTMLSYKIIFTIIDFGFFELGLNTIEANILQSNTRAIRFNKSIGFELQSNQENIQNQLYKLTKQNYKTKTKNIKKIILR